MSDTLTPEERQERQARIDQLIANSILMATDTQKRQQDIRYAPYTLLATGIGAGAALMAALATLLAFLFRWLQR
jgi:hypothetical protein